MAEATNPAHRQNPTSGGRTGLESHILTEGDTLHSVAWARFGDPSYWRAIAEFNGIDDPLRLTPGTRLLIPPRRAAAGLA
jgi:nucleoid-associated protein YgaU